MFNLDKAIAEWRQQSLSAGIQNPLVLDELESHLRDDVEQQVRSGVSAQRAFDAATQRIGQPGVLQAEFKKAEQAKPVIQRKVVWVLIGLAFLGCWIQFGQSPAVVFVYGMLLAGLIVATFIDVKSLVIPDAITIGGALAGLLCSILLPSLHEQENLTAGMLQSLLGIGVGAGLLYLVLRLGKLAFGRQRLKLGKEARIVFADGALLLPDRSIAYEELFCRKGDAITLQARTVNLAGQSYLDVPICLTSTSLQIGRDQFDPKEVPCLEAIGAEIVLPREAMGLGDVKFMAAIGAFLGWQAAVFSLMLSSLLGAMVGCGLVLARRRHWSARMPYGPYLAAAATIWIFAGKPLLGLLLTP